MDHFNGTQLNFMNPIISGTTTLDDDSIQQTKEFLSDSICASLTKTPDDSSNYSVGEYVVVGLIAVFLVMGLLFLAYLCCYAFRRRATAGTSSARSTATELVVVPDKPSTMKEQRTSIQPNL